MQLHNQLLSSGARSIGLDLTENTCSKLLDYLNLIIKWNKAYNLTAIRDPEDMLRLHLLDSLSVVPCVQPFSEQAGLPLRILDVGTGAGLPGIVLAILDPSSQVSLLDTNGKKCRFLNQVKLELNLENVDVIHDRVERFVAEPGYDLVMSRAFATLKDMTDNAHHLLKGDGRFLAMKGRYPEQELEELDQKFEFQKATPLQIPGLDVERYLIEIALKGSGNQSAV